MNGEYRGTDILEVMEGAVRYNRFLLKLVTDLLPAAGPVVDFGAGIGTFAGRLAGLGFDVLALEPDSEQRAIMEARGLMTLTDLSQLDSGSIGLVYSLNVLEHIHDDLGALQTLQSVLKPEGKIIIYVPALPFLFSDMDRKVGHFRRYTKRHLVHLANAAGLNVHYARYADSLGVVATLAYKLCVRSGGDLNPRSVIFYDRWIFPLSRIIDQALGYFVGKNLILIASRQPN